MTTPNPLLDQGGGDAKRGGGEEKANARVGLERKGPNQNKARAV